MALIETTDNLFKEVIETLNSSRKLYEDFISGLSNLFAEFSIPDYEEKLNSFIFDAYIDMIQKTNIDDVKRFMKKNTYIKGIIMRKSKSNLMVRQPIILFLYYIVDGYPNKAKDLWPLTEKDLRPIYIDLGKSFD